MEYNVGDRLVDDARDIVITDKSYFTQHNRRSWYYRYKCNICGYDCSGGYRSGVWKNPSWFSKQQLMSDAKCACCNGSIIVPEINSVFATHREYSKYFLNDDAKKYSVNSRAKIDMICPNCKTIKRNMAISNLYRQGLSCPVCSTTFSLGERIVYEVLAQLGLDFKREYAFPENKYRYDFYVPSHSLIIEVNGRQHYEPNINKLWGDMSPYLHDDQKFVHAQTKGIINYICINASESSFELIKDGILDSSLNNMFDLQLIDWDNIRTRVYIDSMQKRMCEYWELNPDCTLVDMEEKFGISEATLRKYIKLGIEYGWCHKHDTSVWIQTHLHGTYERQHKLLNSAVDATNNTMPIVYLPRSIYFKGANLCSRLSEKVFEKRISASTIRYKLRRKNTEFEYISKEEFNRRYFEGCECYGTPYDEEVLRCEQ